MMMGPIRRAIDRFRGAGSAAITLPPMDGAIRPNQVIETAPCVLEIEAPDNLAFDGRRVFFSSGTAVLSFDPTAATARAEAVATFDHPVTCLAAGTEGTVVAGLNDGSILFVAGARKGRRLTDAGAKPSCPTALAIDGQTLTVCHGSRQNAPLNWKHDLMQRNASGSVWRIDMASGNATCLADGLAFPFGLVTSPDGAIVVSESWRHRIVSISSSTAPSLDNLPGYPARLVPAARDGYWLCVFAPRSRLVEFVLHERDFCADMFREIEPDYWIAPSLTSGRSFLEPLQGGAIKQLGILKPWAPSRSYGLLLRLDAKFAPVASYHSRADGTRHGLTSCVDLGDRVLVASKGGNAIVALDAAAQAGGAP